MFAVAPSLLKWHFQVRGYSWYFLSIPLLTILFLSIQSTPNRRWPLFLLFGATSGLSIWSLELGIAFNLALWVLILMRRSLSLKNALVALAGFIAGYSPAIVFNLTHHFANWNAVLEKTGGGGFTALFHPETLSQIFLTEMPKFFGPIPSFGIIRRSLLRGSYFTRSRCWRQALRPGHSSDRRQKLWRRFAAVSHVVMNERDLLLLLLISACFVPYVTAPFRVPGYFLAGSFFFAALTGRLLARCFASSSTLIRFGGAGIFAAAVITGTAVIARHGAPQSN